MASNYPTINYSGTEIPYIHRDLSWLDFNYRVLQEAKDPSVPLFERLKFLAIYSNNLEEFFRVRVANNRNLLRVGKKTRKELEFDPENIQQEIVEKVNAQQAEFSEIFEKQIVPELKQHQIHILSYEDLNEEQIAFIDAYFNENLLPYVQPVLLVKDKVRPFLSNAALYLVIRMKDKEKSSPRSQYGIVKIPSELTSRFIELPAPDHQNSIILLDDLVRYCTRYLFPGYDILDMHSLKLSRDAELYIDDEYSGDLIQKIKTSLKKRNIGPPSRLVFDRAMPDKMLNYIVDLLGVENFDLLKEGRYHNNFDFFKFPDFDLHHLKNNPLEPLPVEELEEAEDFFAMVNQRDHLIHVPYQSYLSVIRFFEEAASDPEVTHIKVVQYRVAKDSRIMSSLIDAVRAGKQVSVFIEVKARFDEEANLRWGELLEDVGIQVKYSFPGLKVHAKIALIRRQEPDGARLYTYLGTGNFHEGTAKLYCDLGLMTSDPRITGEVARVFSFLETVQVPQIPFEHLMVGQFDLRPKLERLLKDEIKAAKNGKKAKIVLKLNSLQDARMIYLLYKASQEGVKIDLIIRGICSLIPGIKGLSDNIRVRSIVDRYLEHARIFYFYHGGDEKIFLSSADWMVRNLSHRIEVVFPIYDEEIRQEVMDILNIQLSDNVKARLIDHKLTNTYFKDDSDLAIRSQTETYYYYKRKFDQQRRENESQQ